MKDEIQILIQQLGSKKILFFLAGDENFNQYTANLYSSIFQEQSREKAEIVILPNNEIQAAETINLIKNLNLVVGIKNGGHSVGRQTNPPGGIIVGLQKLNKIEIFKEQQQIQIGGGVNMRDINEALQGTGFWVPLGDGETIGYSGFLLHGGISHQYVKFTGLASDLLISATLVLASGEIIEADEKNHPELFQALKGAGSAFGIVTKMKIQLINIQNLSHDYFIYPYSEKLLCQSMIFAKNINQQFDSVGVSVFFGNNDSENSYVEITVAYNDNYGENAQIAENVQQNISNQIKTEFEDEIKQQGLNLKPGDRLKHCAQLLEPFIIFIVNDISYGKICWCSQGFSYEFLTDENIEKLINTYHTIIPQIKQYKNQDINGFFGGYFHALGGKVRKSNSWTGIKNNDIFSVSYEICSAQESEYLQKNYKKSKEFSRMTPGIQADIYANIDLFPNNCEEQKFADYLGGEENLNLLKELKVKYDSQNLFRGNYFDQAFDQKNKD